MDTRLLEASLRGDEQALQALMEDEPLILDRAVTCCEETPLHVAALRGHLNFIKALLDLKPKLASEMDAAGCVPLHLASAEGSAEVVRELLRADADLCGARDGSGRNPLHLGVMKGRLDVVRELIRTRPESAAERLDRGETVFHLCVKYCRLEALKLLVELLKDEHQYHRLLAATDNEGNTVLHFAAFFKQIETVRYLVSLEGVKAIANTMNGNGYTALDVLEKCPRDFNSFEIQEALNQAGVQRGKDLPSNCLSPTIVLHSPTTTTITITTTTASVREQSWIKRWFNQVLEYLTLKHQTDWIADTHGNLMVVATVVATMSFQAGINPPGGVWTEDQKENGTCKECRAGTAILNYTKEFSSFFNHNTTSLMASICVILLHFGGFPLKNKVGTWLITLSMCVMLHNILAAYIFSTNLLVLPYSQNSVNVIYAWTAVLSCVVFVHTTRFWYWLIFEKSKSFLSPENILHRSKWMRIVALLVVIVVTFRGLRALVVATV